MYTFHIHVSMWEASQIRLAKAYSNCTSWESIQTQVQYVLQSFFYLWVLICYCTPPNFLPLLFSLLLPSLIDILLMSQTLALHYRNVSGNDLQTMNIWARRLLRRNRYLRRWRFKILIKSSRLDAKAWGLRQSGNLNAYNCIIIIQSNDLRNHPY